MKPVIHAGCFMQTIKQFMAGDHRHCDDLFAAVESVLAAGDCALASGAFSKFRGAMLCHFAAEESLLFPAFEERTGMCMGPTQVMRGEHVQLRELMAAAGEALVAQDSEAYLGEAETLLIMMQQHNMKEENVLYPMCDQHLLDQVDTILPHLKDVIADAESEA
jgi:iron-sulfur cluster repair protein YtfE (RIC family)